MPTGRALFHIVNQKDLLRWAEPLQERSPADVTKVALNESPREDLLVCPGIGPAFADRILKERARQPFRDWQDLQDRLTGLGDARIKKLMDAGVTLDR